jgi:hypothetical protein
MTVRLDRAGNTYSGSYAADSFDLSGNLIPELHAEGRLRATRITVEGEIKAGRFKVQGARFRGSGSGFRVQGSRFVVQRATFRAFS